MHLNYRQLKSCNDILQDQEDDIEDDEEEDADAGFIETFTPQTSTAAPDSHELLQSAKQFRHKAETLLAKGISSEDSAEIHALLEKTRHAIAAGDWNALETALDGLSDLLFYLED